VKPVTLALPSGDVGLDAGDCPLDLDAILPGSGAWEVEIGFGKGRYLLRRATEDPQTRFLGIEIALKYQRILTRRARRRGIQNLATLRGEALLVLASVLPQQFARTVHVYFPDPWPKARHNRRRLFDPGSVDLVLGLVAPGGKLCFATDFLEYGALVEELLRSFPGLDVRRVEGVWPDGARTNYEAKYIEEGREILRLEAVPKPDRAAFHPRGRDGILVGYFTDSEGDVEGVPAPVGS
jgi:tRNA (guanine-N7-)-methyltransferase